MAEHETPNSIDRRLRNVALPSGLLPRLREIGAMGDVELDFLIRTVPVPKETLDRLREIGSLSDADLDGELRDVELPRGMRHRIDRAMRWQAQRARFIGWAVAASLLAMVGGVAYWAGGDRNVAQQTAPPQQNIARSDGHGQSPANVALPNIVLPNAARRPPADRVAGSGPQGNPPAKVETGPGQPPGGQSPDGSKPSAAPPDAERAANLAQGDVPTQTISDTASGDPPGDGQSVDAQPAGPASIFGGEVAEVPPNLSVVQAPMSRGVSGPHVEGYDLLSELRWGRHPFVVPAMNAALRQSRVPIWTNTSSYETACRMVAHGRLPAPAQVHAEDFLAAMDYGFPLPTGAPVGIRAAAGPAPWGPPGMSLMQIGIQAAKLPRDPAGDTHLTLVVDASAAMRDSGQADLVRRALLRLSEEMGPRDRVSIVAFNASARMLLRHGDRAALRRVLATWNDSHLGGSAANGSADNYLPLDGLSDMAAGVELAAGSLPPAAGGTGEKAARKAAEEASKKAVEKPADRAVEKIVLIADSLEPIDERSLPRLRGMLHKVVDAGAKWEMIGLAQDSPLSPQWEELAEIGGHTVRHADTPDELYQRLNETLAGRSQVVAASVEMKVTFDPAAVSRYRLIGHEIAGGLSGAPLQEDLRSGQAATALYEVELKPDGPTDVAFVELSWRDPISDAPRHLRQPIGRPQFVATWRECALPLQTAAIAALAADVLRNSNLLPANAHVLDQVAALAADVNPALKNRPTIVRLKRLIDQARTAHPSRPGTARAGL